MKTIQVEIRGVTALLIHRFGEDTEQKGSTRRIEIKRISPREEATKNAYIAKDGSFYFSAASIPGTMKNAGSNHKSTGSRKSLRYVVPAAISMLTDAVTILNGKSPAKDFEVDSRPVTIPATKGRVMRHRPRFDSWSAKFDLVIDDNMISIETAQQLLTEAGMSYGIGDFRPEKGGPFGRFRIVSWKEQKP